MGIPVLNRFQSAALGGQKVFSTSKDETEAELDKLLIEPKGIVRKLKQFKQ